MALGQLTQRCAALAKLLLVDGLYHQVELSASTSAPTSDAPEAPARTTWGGNTYDWNSPVIIGLILGALVAGGLFVVVERRAAEPVMPLHLFKERNFNLTTIVGLIIGVAMFGALAYLPTYLQMVTGANATEAGLLMIPLMAALLITSIASGQLVSRTGRYKALPMIGMVLVAASLFLLSTMTPDMAVWVICSYLALMGLGLGMSMQILILIVQNTFPVTEVGTATASNNYFRQIGASLGSAIVGSLFVAKLTQLLSERMPAGAASARGGENSLTPAVVRDLPAGIKDVIVSSYNDALTPIFLYMVPLVIVGLILLVFVVEKPLATSIERDILPETLEIDGGSWDLIDSDAAGDTDRPKLGTSR